MLGMNGANSRAKRITETPDVEQWSCEGQVQHLRFIDAQAGAPPSFQIGQHIW